MSRKVLTTVAVFLMFVGQFWIGYAVGNTAAAPAAPTLTVGNSGPLTVVDDLDTLTQFIPGVPQQRLVAAQLSACADLTNGLTYDATASDMARFGVTGQPGDFLTTSAVDTFCFDQDSKVSIG